MSSEEKFHAAVNVIRSLPKNGSYQPSTELMLRFYAYFKQATLGPCKGARPAFWDVVGRTKYDAWKRLGDMGKQEAMDSYVAELHRIVETMSYTDNVANFLEAQDELESVPLGDLELVAGDVIERVRSQPNSPFASREASPHRLAAAAASPSTSAPDTDHSDDEYIDTIDSAPELNSSRKSGLSNGHLADGIPNGHVSQGRPSRPKTKGSVDVGPEVRRAVQCLQADLERLGERVAVAESRLAALRHARPSLSTLSPSLLAFLLLWPFAAHLLMRRYWPNRK